MNIANEARPIYMKCLRTTSIHGETDSESVLMNILVRNFITGNLLDQGYFHASSCISFNLIDDKMLQYISGKQIRIYFLF